MGLQAQPGGDCAKPHPYCPPHCGKEVVSSTLRLRSCNSSPVYCSTLGRGATAHGPPPPCSTELSAMQLKFLPSRSIKRPPLPHCGRQERGRLPTTSAVAAIFGEPHNGHDVTLDPDAHPSQPEHRDNLPEPETPLGCHIPEPGKSLVSCAKQALHIQSPVTPQAQKRKIIKDANISAPTASA